MGGIINGERNERVTSKYKRLESIKQEPEMTQHKISLEELKALLETDFETGLTQEQAETKLKVTGPNNLKPPPQTLEFIKLCRCMTSGFSLMLWAGGVLCFVTYAVQYSQYIGENAFCPQENLWLGVVLCLCVVIIGGFQYYQQGKTSQIIAAFKKLVPKKALVIRGGKTIQIDASQLVVGDLVAIRAGDQVPADIRILESNQLKVDNSSLTGESYPQMRNNKFTDDNPLETRNLVFFSVYCVEGECTGVVIRTGDDTAMGRIATLASGVSNEPTPIAKEINRFVRMVTILAICIGAMFFAISMAIGYAWIDAMIFVTGVIVANVPEGLLCTLTISLTLAAKRMASNNCLVKNLEAVETLGSTSVICSDKTGTLTTSRMTVVHLWYNGVIHEADLSADQSGKKTDEHGNSWNALVRGVMLCSRAEFKDSTDSGPILQRECIGDATESGLLRFAELTAGQVDVRRQSQRKVAEIPFNSINKFQVSVHCAEEGQRHAYLVVMKGAPERIVNRCATIVMQDKEVPLTSDLINQVHLANETLGGLGERVIGFADFKLPVKEFPKGFAFDSTSVNFPYTGLRFLGLISLMDPPRPDVPMAVERCRKAGIQIVMVTGDHEVTAAAVAKKIGIIQPDSETMEDVAKRLGISVKDVDLNSCKALVITGEQLNEMTSAELDHILTTCKELVFARTSPQQKLIIVEGFQRQGLIVAVTGDGVNDSPALKQADIGIAMGITGSDVSKQAAGMVLVDDNFASIITGVEEGRRIFDNLKKSICYTLASNTPQLAPFVIYILVSIPLPIGTIAILCIDIVTDMVPAISFAYEEAEGDILQRKPRDPVHDRLVTLKLMRCGYTLVGVISTIAAFFSYFMILTTNGFPPGMLPLLRSEWDSKQIIVSDAYGQEWCYAQRKAMEYTCYTAFFCSIVLMQWADLVITKTFRDSILHQGMNSNWFSIFALFFMTAGALFLTYCPGLTVRLGLYPLYFYWWFFPLPFAMLLVSYDEIRKYFIRRYPGGFLDIITCY